MARTRARDEFGELQELKTRAVSKARNNHHALGRFRVRSNDDTKLNAFCEHCGTIVVVNLDPDGYLPPLYGTALVTICKAGQR